MNQAPLYRVLPHFALELLEAYFRVEVEGLENVPRRGPAILIPNHSGVFGLDGLLLSHLLYKERRKPPRTLLHKLWFYRGLLQRQAERFGFLKASYRNGLAVLETRHLLILFPEAELGNFKPSTKKYHLQPFKPGFVRMAGKTSTPVVPVLIIGAEETHFNLGQVRVFGSLFPLPANVVPLPAKWKIRFLPPIVIPPFSGLDRHECERATAEGIRRAMQEVLDQEIAQRRYIYLPISSKARAP